MPDDLNTNPLILNYHDACLYQSDIDILKDPHEWLNSNLIHFGLTWLSRKTSPIYHGRAPEETAVSFLDPSVVSYLIHQCEQEDLHEFACSGLVGPRLDSRDGTRWLVPINDTFAVSQAPTESHNGHHWSCLALYYTCNRIHSCNDDVSHLNVPMHALSAYHMDSSCGLMNCDAAQNVAQIWKRLIEYVLHDKQDDQEVSLSLHHLKVPKQQNGHDCGLHVLETARIAGEYLDWSCANGLEEYLSLIIETSIRQDPCSYSHRWRVNLLETIRTLTNNKPS